MSTILIPELSAYWDEADSFRLAAYKRNGGYQALPKALAMQPDRARTACLRCQPVVAVSSSRMRPFCPRPAVR